MDALSVTPPESASPATAEHLVISIRGPASPLVPGDTGTDIRSINSSAGNEDRGGDAAAEDAGGRRKVLPEELCRNVVKLSCKSNAEGGICEVYVIGTAHVSKESCQEVQAVIRFLQPQVVFLELCRSREALLFPQNLKVASKLEVFPGSEFRVAYEEACNYGGLVKFGDRPVQITLRRTWEKMPLWHRTKLFYSLVYHAFFLPSSEDLNKKLKEMNDIDMMTLENQEMSKQFPTLMETLVHERDQYMSATLLEVAGEYRSVVAVVGKGHLQGIKKYWKQPVELKRLLHVDMCSRTPIFSAVKLLATVGVGVGVAVAVAGICISTKK
ncbi:uncharacterized protein LOC131323065 isoform X2 [Rhododendron vialii]|uniref:uncharacterized protein LOC131323065 isoform X2 n=1 Tax=Rhododendron vialii TaxID=182163 RepID=UPI00265E5DB1|nr:uncharacterized protein LOC131323065 isoform X2 [Rhododendron vialii]